MEKDINKSILQFVKSTLRFGSATNCKIRFFNVFSKSLISQERKVIELNFQQIQNPRPKMHIVIWY